MMPMAGTVVSHAEQVMGTVASFTVHPGQLTERDALAAVEASCDVLHSADSVFSLWLPESPMSRLRNGSITLEQAPAEIGEVLELCLSARNASGGWFDPWVMPGGIDPTGLVKGWAVERALEPLRRAGADAALLNAGGDIAAFSSRLPGERWRIGIRHPWRPDALACVLEITDAVATSGSYERGPHLIDPRDGRPGGAAASATVTGPRLAMADALATAVAVGGEEALERVRSLDGYEAYMIGTDGSETATDGIAFAS